MEQNKRDGARGVRGGETDLEKLESLGLQRFRGQSGERRAQTLLTDAQGLALPQGAFWETTHTHKPTQTHANTRAHRQT